MGALDKDLNLLDNKKRFSIAWSMISKKGE